MIKFISDLSKPNDEGVICGPTFRELAVALNCRSVRSVVKHCHSLKAKGMVENIAKEARTLALTALGKKTLQAFLKTPEAAEAVIGQIKVG